MCFPAIFNINEPIVFGAPVVWNPILMIPLCLNSIIISKSDVSCYADRPCSYSKCTYADVVSAECRTGLSDNEQYDRCHSGNRVVCCFLADLDAIL